MKLETLGLQVLSHKTALTVRFQDTCHRSDSASKIPGKERLGFCMRDKQCPGRRIVRSHVGVSDALFPDELGLNSSIAGGYVIARCGAWKGTGRCRIHNCTIILRRSIVERVVHRRFRQVHGVPVDDLSGIVNVFHNSREQRIVSRPQSSRNCHMS